MQRFQIRTVGVGRHVVQTVSNCHIDDHQRPFTENALHDLDSRTFNCPGCLEENREHVPFFHSSAPMFIHARASCRRAARRSPLANPVTNRIRFSRGTTARPLVAGLGPRTRWEVLPSRTVSSRGFDIRRFHRHDPMRNDGTHLPLRSTPGLKVFHTSRRCEQRSSATPILLRRSACPELLRILRADGLPADRRRSARTTLVQCHRQTL